MASRSRSARFRTRKSDIASRSDGGAAFGDAPPRQHRRRAILAIGRAGVGWSPGSTALHAVAAGLLHDPLRRLQCPLRRLPRRLRFGSDLVGQLVADGRVGLRLPPLQRRRSPRREFDPMATDRRSDHSHLYRPRERLCRILASSSRSLSHASSSSCGNPYRRTVRVTGTSLVTPSAFTRVAIQFLLTPCVATISAIFTPAR